MATIFGDGGEESAEVARKDAHRHNAAVAAEQQAVWTAKQKAIKTAEQARQPDWTRGVEPTASARALLASVTPEHRAAKIKARRQAEVRATAAAIERATNPPVPDPRSSAERLAEGAGQSRL